MYVFCQKNTIVYTLNLCILLPRWENTRILTLYAGDAAAAVKAGKTHETQTLLAAAISTKPLRSGQALHSKTSQGLLSNHRLSV